jgi:hypothetical protein
MERIPLYQQNWLKCTGSAFFLQHNLGERLLLEERAERFQTRAVDISQEATQTGAVRKTSASEERHEG